MPQHRITRRALLGSRPPSANAASSITSWNSPFTRSSTLDTHFDAAQPTFVAALAGLYVLQLIVNDGFEDSAADTVAITAGSTNRAPVANAGPDQAVAQWCAEGAPITYTRDQLSEHVSLAITATSAVLRWIDERLSGQPAPQGCSTRTVPTL